MVFVAEALGGWLVGQLADAGRKKLTELVIGSEQERALRRAADVAVWATAEEVSLSGGAQAGQVATVISEVFRDPVPEAPLAGPVMLLERLQAGIAGQLAVLDDAGLTGTGQSAADVLGVPGAVLADKLTTHLVREIIVRGSGGGPLWPLAGQFNHEVTRRQIGGMLAQLAADVRDALARPDSGVPVAGRPLEEVTDPFLFEVHRPVEPNLPQPELPELPVYVPREHDAALAEMVTAAAAGLSGIAVLVGGSSTGKTRACWQALDLLRGLELGWRVWHPIDPQGALAGLPGVEPRTVVWLNEAQRYLDAADGTGERVAARFRELLSEQDRGPVLVLATLWPVFWDELTVRPPGGADPHAQARELLSGHAIQVPNAFTPRQLQELGAVGDPRLAQAVAGSRDGQVIQYLAGAYELLGRYHNAPPAARALIDAAVDARRLGMQDALSRAFLEAAAPGYLTNTDWDLLGDDWLEQALSYTAKPCKGVRGPLTPIRPRPVPGAPDSPDEGPTWQLADYLNQQGRRARREVIPPGGFWAAIESCADPADLTTVAGAAEDRGLLRDAARLYKEASAHGYPDAGTKLVQLLHILHPGDPRPADWATAHANLDDPDAVTNLLGVLQWTGAGGVGRRPPPWQRIRSVRAEATGQVVTLGGRAAAHARLDNADAVSRLLSVLHEAGATGQIARLLDRDPAAHANLDDPAGVAVLLSALHEAGATDQFTTLANRAAADASLDDVRMVAGLLLVALYEAGATDQFTTLADRAAAHARLDDPFDMSTLLSVLHEAGATRQIARLLDRDPAAHASLDNPYGVADLLDALREVRASGQVAALLDRDPAAHISLDLGEGAVGLLGRDLAAFSSLDPTHAVAVLLEALHNAGATSQVATLGGRAAAYVSLDHPGASGGLLLALAQAGATSGVATLLARDPAAHASLDYPGVVAGLLDALRTVGATSQVATLGGRAAAHARLDDPGGVAGLLRALRVAGAAGQVATLLGRDPAAHSRLDHPGGVATLLDALREAEAAGQVATLLARDPAAHVSLNYRYGRAVPALLKALHAAGAQTQTAELIERLPAAGLFHLFCEQEGRGDQFRFGRRADGRPAGPWAWTDLC